jgi:hypothetical protein
MAHISPWEAKNMVRAKAGITVTTGRTMAWDDWVAVVDYLEARARLAEENGLPKTAQSWRSVIENLEVAREPWPRVCSRARWTW